MNRKSDSKTTRIMSQEDLDRLSDLLMEGDSPTPYQVFQADFPRYFVNGKPVSPKAFALYSSELADNPKCSGEIFISDSKEVAGRYRARNLPIEVCRTSFARRDYGKGGK